MHGIGRGPVRCDGEDVRLNHLNTSVIMTSAVGWLPWRETSCVVLSTVQEEKTPIEATALVFGWPRLFHEQLRCRFRPSAPSGTGATKKKAIPWVIRQDCAGLLVPSVG
jgi:hypothetical protein